MNGLTIATLVRNRCKKCSTEQIESRIICIKCRNESFEKIQVEAKGKIISHTELHALPQSIQGKKKIYLVIVELEQGGRILGQFHSEKSASPKIGAQVIGIDGIISINLEGIEEKGLIFYYD